MDGLLLEKLVDPVDKGPLRVIDGTLQSASGRTYPIVDGIPVMLVEGIPQTTAFAEGTLKAVSTGRVVDPWYLATAGISGAQISELTRRLSDRSYRSVIDPAVSYLIAATNGLLYERLVGELNDYPIPDIRLPPPVDGDDRSLLDIGCGWGRWSFSAARKGYNVVGLDPSLGALLAARRVARQTGVSAQWVVGDARFLPFKDCAFGHIFSYSVIQHFSKSDAHRALLEVKRVLSNLGVSLIQMPNAFGIRSFYHLLGRGFREGKEFEVRYYKPRDLLMMFERSIGPSEISVDGYLGLGIQASDKRFMSIRHKAVIYASELLRISSLRIPFLKFAADSLYVESKKIPQ